MKYANQILNFRELSLLIITKQMWLLSLVNVWPAFAFPSFGYYLRKGYPQGRQEALDGRNIARFLLWCLVFRIQLIVHWFLRWFPPHKFSHSFFHFKTCVELLHEERVQVPVRRCAESVQIFVESWGDKVVWNVCGACMILTPILTFP